MIIKVTIVKPFSCVLNTQWYPRSSSMGYEALLQISLTLEPYSKRAKATRFIALRLNVGNSTPDEAMGVNNNGSWKKKAHRLQLMSCFSSESIKMLLVANNKVSETMRNCSVIRGRKFRVGWDSEREVQQLLGVLRVQVFFTLTLV